MNKSCTWSITLCGAESWILEKVGLKYPDIFEMCWRRIEKIGQTDHVRNEEVLRRIKEDRNIVHIMKRSEANWIAHILCRNCLLKQVVERKM